MGVTAGLAESNGSLLPGLWRDSLHVTCGLTACTPGSAQAPTLGNEYGKTLPLPIKTAWTYLWIRTWSISGRLQFHLTPADIIHLTSNLKFDQFAASYRLRCVLLWIGPAVAVPAAVVGQVNTSSIDVTADPITFSSPHRIALLLSVSRSVRGLV